MKVPVGEGAGELAASLKDILVTTPNKLWREEKRAEENGCCIFSFKASVVQSLAPGDSLEFKLVDVKVNAKSGTVRGKFLEQAGVNQPWCEKGHDSVTLDSSTTVLRHPRGVMRVKESVSRRPWFKAPYSEP